MQMPITCIREKVHPRKMTNMPKRANSLKIFQKIAPKWDFDLHVHTNWSGDAAPDATIEKYAQLSEKYKIHIGFADHYELACFEKPLEIKRTFKLNPETISNYLEEIDSAKEQYSHVTSGLELEYYPHREDQLRDFLDDYREDFDLIVGSAHEIEDFKAITVLKDLEWLVNKNGSFSNVLNMYFEKLHKLIQCQLFDVVAHPDVIFRFLTGQHQWFTKEYRHYLPTIELGHLAKNSNILYEINLSGLYYPWKEPFPNLDMFHHLLTNDILFSIGSDSHSLDQFKERVLQIRKINYLNRNEWKYHKIFSNSKD